MEQRELNELASDWPRRPLRQHTPRHYLVHFLWPTSPTSGNLPKENLLILKTSGGSAATGTVSRKMMCRNCKKKLNIVITPGTYLPMCKKFYRKWWRKLSKYKDLTYLKKKDLYGKNKFSICRIFKSSAQQPGSHYRQGCACKKSLLDGWKKGFRFQKLPANICLDVLMKFPVFFMILLSALTFQGVT